MDGPKDLDFYLKVFAGCELPIPISYHVDTRQELRIIQKYLETLDVSKDLEVIARNHPPMDPNTRAVILLPARFEEKRIKKLLQALDFEMQNLQYTDNEKIEVIILNNWHHGEQPDCTSDVISNHLQGQKLPYTLLYCEREWLPHESQYPLSNARKLLADYALYRAVQRKTSPGPLYLLTEDADVEGIELGRTQKMIRYLDAHPEIDAIMGGQERTPYALARNNLLLFERRSWNFTQLQLSQRRYWPERLAQSNFYWHRVVTGGWNICFTARVYALIGGYTPDVRIFEDMDIGQRISVIRGRWFDNRFTPNVSTVRRVPWRATSSAVRAILSLIEKRHIYDNSNLFGFFFDRKYEDMVRHSDLEDLLAEIENTSKISDLNIDHFNFVATNLFIETKRIFGFEEEALRVFNRVMWMMGFEIDKNQLRRNSNVTINDFTKFQEYAQRFTKRNLHLKDNV